MRWKDENGEVLNRLPKAWKYDGKVYFTKGMSNAELEEIGITPFTETATEPSEDEIVSARSQEIKSRLVAIDYESIRPISAIVSNTNSNYDIEKLSALEEEKTALREELATLQGE